jgi:hypothetical protein
VNFIKNRLRRLEDRDGSGEAGCPECYLKPQAPRVFYPGEGEPRPEPERCPECGRLLGPLFRVVYEDEEGEGVSAERPM